MTYLSIWEKICKYFERDCEETSRAAWENLTLSFRGKLSSYEWRAYAAKFLTLMRRTPGATEGEGLRLLRKQLPSFLWGKIEAERARRRGTGRSLLLGGLDLNSTESTIAAWLVPVTGYGASRVWREREFFAVDCCNDSQYSKLLSLNGCGLDNGAVLKVLPRNQDFSVQSAIELVSELIERKERVEEAKRYERQPRDTQRQEKNARTIEFEGPRNPNPEQQKSMLVAKRLAIEGAMKSLESSRQNSPARSTSSGKGGGKAKGKGGGGNKKKMGRWTHRSQEQPKTQQVTPSQPTQHQGGKGQGKGQNQPMGKGGRGGGPPGGQ